MTTPSDPQADALSSDELLQWVSELRERADALMQRLAAAGLVITAPDVPASAAPADDTEMRDIIRDWWLNAETREPDAQEPADLPDTLVRYLSARGYVLTAPDAPERGGTWIPLDIWKAIESFQSGVIWYAAETGDREPKRQDMERRKERLIHRIAVAIHAEDIDTNGFAYSRDCSCSWCRGYFAEKAAAGSDPA